LRPSFAISRQPGGRRSLAHPATDSSGRNVMADKTSFTKDEWALLLRSPMNAGMAITAAEPSGLFGLLKKAFAGVPALAEAATGANTNPLIKAIVSDFQTSDGRTVAHDGLKSELAN